MATILRRVMNPELYRVIRFGLTGAAGFLTDFGTLVAAHSGLRVALVPSLVLAYTLGGIVHYGLTRWWVFPARHTTPEAGRIVRYLLLAAVNAGITLVAVPAMTHAGLDYRIAKVICVAVLFGANYFLVPRFVMPVRGEADRSAA